MACPPPNPNPDAPIGSPILGDPCDPCFKANPDDLFGLVKNLSAEVCALTTRLNNMYQLFGRTRNRLTKVEDTLNNLPEEEESQSSIGCAGLETTAEADAVLVCEDGAEKAFVPGSVPEHIVFCGGKAKKVAKGLQFYPLTTKQLIVNQSAMASNNPGAVLPQYPTDVCGPVWAVFENDGQSFPGPSSSPTTIHVSLNGYIMFRTGTAGDQASCQASAPVTSSTVTFNVVVTGVGVRNFTTTLIGYMY